MSNTTDTFLQLCMTQLGITNHARLEDIGLAYEKWKANTRFPRFEQEGVRIAWVGPVHPETQPQSGRWQPIASAPLYGFIENDEGKMLGFRFAEKRPFESVDFDLILDFLRRGNELSPNEISNYFRKMYRLPIDPVDYSLDWHQAPIDWNLVGVWNLRWIITGLDMESAQKKGIFEFLCDEMRRQWIDIQEATLEKWNPRLLALLRLEPASTYGDYDGFKEFIIRTTAPTVQGFARHPWVIGVINRKSRAIDERKRFQLAKALTDGQAFDEALSEILEISAEHMHDLEGKTLGQLADGNPLTPKK